LPVHQASDILQTNEGSPYSPERLCIAPTKLWQQAIHTGLSESIRTQHRDTAQRDASPLHANGQRVFGALPRREGTLSIVRSLDIKRQMSADDIAEVSTLLRDAERADGSVPLSDHMWLDLREGGRRGFAGLVAREPGHDHPVAYCQLSQGIDSWAVEIVVHPHHRYDMAAIGPDLMRAAIEILGDEGGGHLHWWVFEPSQVHHTIAEQIGLTVGRTLLQLRRALPLEPELTEMITDFVTCRFRPGLDDDDWLSVNNAAFATHPEQGGWTHDTLNTRCRAPWFDPDGFILHHIDDTLAGFCWMKVHKKESGDIGEIYVVAVNPDFQNQGLGARLAIAGLDHTAKNGCTVGMLYVDADNLAALRMYKKLGFTAHQRDRAFVGDIPARTK
jgi:mycothiol synthase